MENTNKYWVVKTTKFGVESQRCKCSSLYWSKDPSECWRFSKQGAQKIADGLNT